MISLLLITRCQSGNCAPSRMIVTSPPLQGKGGGKVGVKGQGTTQDKGKGKAKLEADPGKDIGTDQSSDRKRKPKKSVLSHLILS
jgi:hypothetical protein